MGLMVDLKYDPETDDMVQHQWQDCTDILQETKRLRDEVGDGYTPSRDLRRVAHIPDILIVRWLQEGINVYQAEHWPKVAARLDDPDYAYLRTSYGKVSSRPAREYPTTRPR